MRRTYRRGPVVASSSSWERACAQRLGLGPGGGAYTNVPLWSGAQLWARVSVPVAYDLRYRQIKHLLPGNEVSRGAVVRVADARARFADGSTGRHCRPTNETLAAVSGLSVRTVQRASLVLKLLGCATEVLRGRQRTRVERLASWRLGDRARGWASVWALHPPHPVLYRAVDNPEYRAQLWVSRNLLLSSHPRRGLFSGEKDSLNWFSPTGNHPQDGAGPAPPINGGPAGHAATQKRPDRSRRQCRDDARGRVLAARWLAEGATPTWAHKHSARGWASVLAAPAAHGWTPEDVNTAIREWASVGGKYLPAAPYKPIGLLGAILKARASDAGWDDRPAAAEEAREAQCRAAEIAHSTALRADAATARAQAVSPASRAAHLAAITAHLAARRHRRVHAPGGAGIG
ncbi:repa [Mycobacteroides abscessus]|uniref:repa n=1 Tax=Mycobacteroides abscessus TaxID=36809 RepID=UPI001877FF09|nr:hypothetical protein [Mycobacteroides abscessus]